MSDAKYGPQTREFIVTHEGHSHEAPKGMQ